MGSPPVDDEFLYSVVDVLERIGNETGKTISQVAINYLLKQQAASNIIIGARNEIQLIENLEAVEGV